MVKLNDKSHFRKMFKNNHGNPESCLAVDENILNEYTGVLPEELLLHWKKDGWCSYSQGRLWFVNPDEYESIMRDYLKDTQFENRQDLYVVARSAFGELYLWEKGKGNTLEIDSLVGMILLRADKDRQTLSQEEEEFEMNRFIGTTYRLSNLDYEDANDKPLFEKALKKLGTLEANEMYGYKLALTLGGGESLSNIEKVDLAVYFDISRQLKEPIVGVSDAENNTLTY